mmetsp:Transcript_16134/g.35408  ORF Transcript_16134/g.35408 Transcript_16134/m.35408 type:complete len:211 (+) Transcript_16134:120-752(+)|eukprot:CAMPEP_0206627158 /NCGR_PEP_ID=MMETSP0325_2-20121206/65771_1 /ASSEMBLY_ACC=CAM_ASM_000347 /TAXON_ID=2866 /ORGANISM="Crypthecodinium cohnii, Strain Seligo" /LENGTH=210 /DNA_ID=CAMNT_0054151693 /DNA_START=106 /DNA_END=738 /DNA_ORIENTATION=+
MFDVLRKNITCWGDGGHDSTEVGLDSGVQITRDLVEVDSDDARSSVDLSSIFGRGKHLKPPQVALDMSSTSSTTSSSGATKWTSMFSLTEHLPLTTEFQVTLKKSGTGRKIGLETVSVYRKTTGDSVLRVQEVKRPGLVHEWNCANPEQQIRPGDDIFEVNGKFGHCEMLYAELALKEEVRLWVRRAWSRNTTPDSSAAPSTIGDDYWQA